MWSTHLVDDHEAKKPYYGFSTAPVLVDGTLVVEIGAGEGKAIAGFDPADGSLRWSLGDDTIDHQSPISVEIGGQPQVMAAGGTHLFGIDAATGETLWSYEHGGDDRAMGGATIIPVPAGPDRFLLLNRIDGSTGVPTTCASPHQAGDVAQENRALWSFLRERGYRPAGGEVPEGYGWPCWRGHTDELLAALFPLGRGPA